MVHPAAPGSRGVSQTTRLIVAFADAALEERIDGRDMTIAIVVG
jgi:hypothetical protein